MKMQSGDKLESSTVIMMTFLLFTLASSYCILRCLKDAVTLTGIEAGAEMLPFIKVWGMLPAAVTLASLFTLFRQRVSITKLFYLITTGFLSYYLAFAFWIFPNREQLELASLSCWLTGFLPAGCRGLIQMIHHWPVSSFYVMSEIWATAMINIFFWGFTNERISKKMAQGIYGKIKIGSTVSAIAGGYLASLVTVKHFNPHLPYGSNIWEQTLINDTLIVTFLGIIAMVLFGQISQRLQAPISDGPRKKREQMSLPKSLLYISQSPYLICLSIIVVGYSLAFNLGDVLWKQKVSEAYPDPSDLMAYMNKIMMIIGVISFSAVLFSGRIVKRFGWTTLGGITPMLMLTTFLGFFIAWALGLPLPAILGLGAANNCISKAGKYSVFSISKELAYTPLDIEAKWNGKAAIDGIGNDLGKTGSSLMHQALLIAFGSMTLSFPYVAGIVLIVLLAWIAAVQFIGRAYDAHFETPLLSESVN